MDVSDYLQTSITWQLRGRESPDADSSWLFVYVQISGWFSITYPGLLAFSCLQRGDSLVQSLGAAFLFANWSESPTVAHVNAGGSSAKSTKRKMWKICILQIGWIVCCLLEKKMRRGISIWCMTIKRRLKLRQVKASSLQFLPGLNNNQGKLKWLDLHVVKFVDTVQEQWSL